MKFFQKNLLLNREIHKTAKRLAQRKQTILASTTGLVNDLRTQLVSPASFCFAGLFGYIVGEFSQCSCTKNSSTDEKSESANLFGNFQSLVKLVLNVVALDSLFAFSQVSDTLSPDEDRSSNRF